MGVVFTRMGQDFEFYYGPGLGRERIFFWNGNPLPRHPVVGLSSISDE